ncbi:MAG TPA: PGPGW domain-containing protein [Chthoniobacterales bacterium]|nr:PGPGW domain-containing protein [Chthoniobacterales bacterium]
MHRLSEFLAPVRLQQAPQVIRKIVIAVIGMTVLLIGVALLVLPGPAIIVIPIGLGILASEFIWARRVIKRGRILVKRARRVVRGSPAT